MEKPCVVCRKPVVTLQAVAAWDAPCCLTHDLAKDYRVGVVIRPWPRSGEDNVSFTVEHRIQIAVPA